MDYEVPMYIDDWVSIVENHIWCRFSTFCYTTSIWELTPSLIKFFTLSKNVCEFADFFFFFLKY